MINICSNMMHSVACQQFPDFFLKFQLTILILYVAEGTANGLVCAVLLYELSSVLRAARSFHAGTLNAMALIYYKVLRHSIFLQLLYNRV